MIVAIVGVCLKVIAIRVLLWQLPLSSIEAALGDHPLQSLGSATMQE